MFKLFGKRALLALNLVACSIPVFDIPAKNTYKPQGDWQLQCATSIDQVKKNIFDCQRPKECRAGTIVYCISNDLTNLQTVPNNRIVSQKCGDIRSTVLVENGKLKCGNTEIGG